MLVLVCAGPLPTEGMKAALKRSRRPLATPRHPHCFRSYSTGTPRESFCNAFVEVRLTFVKMPPSELMELEA